MKKDESRVEKFLESLFELNSGDFDQIQGVLTTIDVEEANEETPAEAAKRRTIDEKRKSIANAFFARLQENPPMLGADGLESLAERPLEESKPIPFLAVTGPSHALIPGDTGKEPVPAFIPDQLMDMDVEVDGELEDAGELSLLPLEGNNPLMGSLLLGPEPAAGEVSYDDMLSALLITEAKEEESLRHLEVETQRIVEASVIDDDDDEDLFDPVPLIALTESDVAMEGVTASTASFMEDVLVAEPALELGGGGQSATPSNPEAAFIKEMFKNRPGAPGMPHTPTPARAVDNVAARVGPIDAAEGRSVLAGPAANMGPGSQQFDSKARVNEGVLTYSFGAERAGAHTPGQPNWGNGVQQPPPGFQPRPPASRPSSPGVAHTNSNDQLHAYRPGHHEQGRHYSQERMVPENRMGGRPGAAGAESTSQPAIATSTSARAPMIAGNPSMHGLSSRDNNGLVPISSQGHQNPPTMHPSGMGHSLSSRNTGAFAPIQPHTTGAFAPIQPHNTGAFAPIQPHNTGAFPPIQPHNTGGFAPVHSGMYQMIDGVPHPLHLPTGVGPASMHSQAGSWSESDDWDNHTGGSRLFFVIAGISLAVIVLLGSVWLGWFYNPTRKVKQVAAVTDQNPAKVRIESEPVGASVFLGDIATGKVTPTTLRLAQGKHTIILRKKGFTPRTHKVLVKNEPTLFFQLAMTPLPKASIKKVTMYITTVVGKSEVWLNGKRTKHKTPVFLKVVPGQYAVQLRRKRYRTRIKVVRIGEKPFYHVKIRWR